MAEVVDADREVDPAGLRGGEPDLGPKAVARDRRANPRREQQIVAADRLGSDVSRDLVEPCLPYAKRSRLVVLRVRLHEEAFAGRGVLLGRLDDGVLDSDHAAEEVDMARPQRDDFAPAHSSLDERLNQQPIVRRHGSNEALELAPSAREEWAARLDAEEPEVRSEVEALMRSYAGAADFLDGPALVDPAAAHAEEKPATPEADPAEAPPPDRSRLAMRRTPAASRNGAVKH